MWDKRYSESGYAYGTAPNNYVDEMVDKLPKGRALCLAEGEGRNAVFLAERGWDVEAVDLSEVGLTKARKLAGERGVGITTTALDLAHLDVEGESYDVIVSIFAHVPPPVRKHVHAQVLKGLKKGGAFLLEAYTVEQLELKTGGPPVAELMMSLDILRDELDGLRFEHAAELQRDVVEGKYHTGNAAVVQLLAFKD
jgi:2-polyprenyl-3-methyl-5-hydroxy-6-metoxy-1,4-benzoquinol methylase